MNYFGNFFYNPWTGPHFNFLFALLIVLVAVWSIVWKGLALWKSARQDNKVWFVIFLVINTVGILEILYIYIFSKKSGSKEIASLGETK